MSYLQFGRGGGNQEFPDSLSQTAMFIRSGRVPPGIAVEPKSLKGQTGADQRSLVSLKRLDVVGLLVLECTPLLYNPGS